MVIAALVAFAALIAAWLLAPAEPQQERAAMVEASEEGAAIARAA